MIHCGTTRQATAVRSPVRTVIIFFCFRSGPNPVFYPVGTGDNAGGSAKLIANFYVVSRLMSEVWLSLPGACVRTDNCRSACALSSVITGEFDLVIRTHVAEVRLLPPLYSLNALASVRGN